MRPLPHPRFFLPVVVALLLPRLAAAEPSPHEWLTRISQAVTSLNYEGVFVYRHGNQLDSMRVLHRVDGGLVRERLISLNGAGREIIRHGDEVRCYLPDNNAVLVEQRRAGRGFPDILPASLAGLERNYVIEVGRAERIANRSGRVVTIRPKDHFRYGYQLWADEATGLLLKANLVDEQGRLIEQFLFTQINIGARISDAELAPAVKDKDLVWQRSRPPDEPPPDAPPTMNIARLPNGFVLTRRLLRSGEGPAGRREGAVEQWVLSDGLAVVSVFVAPGDGRGGAVQGLVNKGAVNAFGRSLPDFRVTVVGEVPGRTVQYIGEAITPAR